MQSDPVGKGCQFDPYGIPSEVMVAPQTFIIVMGLDINANSSHQAIWTALTANRRVDRPPLSFKLKETLQLPPMKTKRQSYEWYIPKGILKSNWISKYLNHVPGIIVLFCDLDWNDPNWTQKKNDLAAKVQSVKSSLGNRSTRLAVVLIQSVCGAGSGGTALPGEGSGTAAAERAATLCTACDLPAKHLFVLPHSDAHLMGYTLRLETALSEIAGGFYVGLAKNVRGHRDFLNKTNHQLLFVRHHFKIGLLNEMRNDPQSAIKHYLQCYHHLLELRFTDTNLQEIRVAAAIVNYKICRLDFVLNLPRDAISQFRRHIDTFRQRTGPKELIFEHYAWLAKQYELFGLIFEEAVQAGLPAVQTQHPGFYYQQAAQYAVLRRQTALNLCKDVCEGESELLDGWSTLEYYGQRPWRAGKHSLEPPEPEREQKGIKAVQYHELHVIKHCDLVIPLFSSAISQFKKYRCPRIKRHLMVQMASEYQLGKDPAKALTLLNHVMWDYRNERWWTLLSSSSLLALQCAYETAAINDYVALLLEIMGPRIAVSDDVKCRIYSQGLLQLLKGEAPATDAHDSSTAIQDTWASVVMQTIGLSAVCVDMTPIVPCIEVRATLPTAAVTVQQQILLVVKLRNSFVQPLQLSSVSVNIGNGPSQVTLTEQDCTRLLLPARSVVQVELPFLPLVHHANSVLKISGVTAQLVGLSGEQGLTILLQWAGSGNEGVTAHTANMPAYKEFSHLSRDEFDTLNVISQIEVGSRKPKMEVELEYDRVALVWEWLPVVVCLTSQETGPITALTLSLSLEASAAANLEQTTQVSTAAGLQSERYLAQLSDHPLGDLGAGQTVSTTVYVKALTAACRTMLLKISYSTVVSLAGAEVACPCTYSQQFDITSKIPFQVTVETQSLKFKRISQVACEEQFLVVPHITCMSHVPLVLTQSRMVLSNQVKQEGQTQSCIAGTELSSGEVGVDCFCVSVASTATANSTVPLGQYLLHWKRCDTTAPAVSVSVGLPSVLVEQWGVWVEACVPPQGVVRSPATISYKITNRGVQSTEVAVSMQASDAFMFAGYKEVRLRVLPRCTEQVDYILYPLLAGYIQLPRLTIAVEAVSSPAAADQGSAFDPLLARILPTHLYVLPQTKQAGASVDVPTLESLSIK